MKTFNRAEFPNNIYGRIIPVGAFYGKINLVYMRKVTVGKYRVTDKDGYLVFNSDGTPKTGYKTRLEKCHSTVIYSIENFHLYKDQAGNNWFRAHILYEGATKWQETILGESALTRELNKYIAKGISDWCEKTGKPFTSLVCDLPSIKSKNNYVPKRRNVKVDYLYRGKPGYATNPHIMTDNIKPRSAIVHTNMDKLHPVDNRPIYRPKNRPYKPEKEEVHKILLSDTMTDGTPFTVEVTNNNHYV